MSIKKTFKKIVQPIAHPIQTKNECKQEFNNKVKREEENIKNKQEQEQPISDMIPLGKTGLIFIVIAIFLFVLFWFTNQFTEAFPKYSVLVPIAIVIIIILPFAIVIFKKIKEMKK